MSTTTSPEDIQKAIDLVNAIQEEPELEAEDDLDAPTRVPSDGAVELIGGLLALDGVDLEAQVRELTGRDEEAIARATTAGKTMSVILARGVESIGGRKPTTEDLDMLLVADRDLLLLKIREVTFGDEVEMSIVCNHCEAESDVTLRLSEDVPVKRLEDPIGDRTFTVPLRKGGEAIVTLPTGFTQKEVFAAGDKTISELNSIMLFGCIKRINGRDVISKDQILELGIKDREEIIKALFERAPGPQWGEVKVECPACGEEVLLPLSADGLFRQY